MKTESSSRLAVPARPPLEVRARAGRLSPAVALSAPARDAILATAALIGAVALGSGGFAYVDPALLGYLGATLVAAFATTWRLSAFWRRPASAFYARALVAAVTSPYRLPRAAGDAARDLAMQEPIRRRSRARWIAHLLLSLGTMASFAITLPLVFGWMHFAAAGESGYRLVVLTIPVLRLAVDGPAAWMLFHGLSLAAVAVVLGAAYLLLVRLRARRLPGTATAADLGPLALLAIVALTGLALPASRDWPALFAAAAWAHQAAVVVLLVALPFSKLGHVLVRPLQIGARAVRADDQAWEACAGCGARLAPVAQREAVASLLGGSGGAAAPGLATCPACRRRQLAIAQSAAARSRAGIAHEPGGGPEPLREAV